MVFKVAGEKEEPQVGTCLCILAQEGSTVYANIREGSVFDATEDAELHLKEHENLDRVYIKTPNFAKITVKQVARDENGGFVESWVDDAKIINKFRELISERVL